RRERLGREGRTRAHLVDAGDDGFDAERLEGGGEVAGLMAGRGVEYRAADAAGLDLGGEVRERAPGDRYAAEAGVTGRRGGVFAHGEDGEAAERLERAALIERPQRVGAGEGE